MTDTILSAFDRAFGGRDGAAVYFAPGRVNLIGEHTDYNGGHVFPCALTLGTYAAVRERSDGVIRLCSVNMPEAGVTETSVGDFRPLEDNSWTAYVKGVMWVLDRRGYRMDRGLDIAIGGDLPSGAGLSSSASLEVLTGFFLRDIFGFDVTDIDLALIGREAENGYVGVNCGIMDQFASAMGREDRAIFLDTNTLNYEYVPLDMAGKLLIVTNTNKKHALNDSAYNRRREECAEALRLIKTAADVNTLGDLDEETFKAVKEVITDPVLLRRARHAVTENQRTIRAAEVLKRGDMETFGRLMNASHDSLRDDYEVSCPELDILAEAARDMGGVYGSRMTGGGFGGCTVTLIDADAAAEYREKIGEIYRRKAGYDCSFYTVSAGDGPHRVI